MCLSLATLCTCHVDLLSLLLSTRCVYPYLHCVHVMLIYSVYYCPPDLSIRGYSVYMSCWYTQSTSTTVHQMCLSMDTPCTCHVDILSLLLSNITNLRYADDTVLLAETEEDLQKIVDQVKRESESFGLLMNAKKTKTMVLSKSSNPPNTRIHIEGKLIEKVQTFTYLGALMTEDGRSEKEIKRK